MHHWLQAGRDHRQLLMDFVCVEKQENLSGVAWQKYAHAAPWAQKAQRLVRSIRSPVKPPEHCHVALSPQRARIDAIISFYHEPLPDKEHHFHLNVLARHLACSNRGMGAEALDRFLKSCEDITDTLDDVERIILTAEAHQRNGPVHGLLSTTRWELSDDVHPDPDFDNWQLVIDVK